MYNITTGGDDGYTFINSVVTKLKNINIIKNTKTICCLTLNKVFIDIDEITKFYKNENVFNIQPEDIIKCCNGQSEYSGKSVNGKPLKWKFISDCEKNELNNILKNETDKNKIILINNELKRIEDLEYLNSIDSNIISNKNNKPVYSPTLDKIFSSQAEAFNFTKDKKYFDVVSDRICECCEGKRISTGKVKNGERIEWIYLSYCNKEKLTNLLSKETNGLNIVLIKAELEKFKDPEYEKIIEEKNEEIKKKIDEMKKNEKEKLKIKTIKPHHTSQAVYSPTLNMLFQSIRKANYFCKENNYKSYCKGINDCCKGNERYSKKLPDDTPIEWKYLSYCTKQTLEELLTKESDETKIYVLKNELEKFKDPEYEKIVEEKNKELEKQKIMNIYKTNRNLKPIYSPTLDMLFINNNEIENFSKNNNLKFKIYGDTGILKCCKGIINNSGKLQDGTLVKWQYISNVNKQTLNKLLTKEFNKIKIFLIKKELLKFEELECTESTTKIKIDIRKIPVYSPTLNRMFTSFSEATKFTMNKKMFISAAGKIKDCCKKERNYSGMLLNGTQLEWKYLSDVDKQTLEELLKNEIDEEKIYWIKKELPKFENVQYTRSLEEKRENFINKEILKKSYTIPVYSLTLDKVFVSFAEAVRFTKNKKIFKYSAIHVKECCKKERRYSGILLDGTLLEWAYLSDVDKQTLEKLLLKETDEDKIIALRRELLKFKK